MANEKEFDTPKTVNVTELAEAVAKKTAEEILKKTTLPAAPTALTEKVADMGKPYNYRPEVIRLMKENDTLRMPRDEANKVSDLIEKMGPRGFVDKDGHRFEEKTLSESMLKETIGAASGGGMQAWAADVFRCCPYPASAFWDAPFIKWHEDVHGKPGGTVTVTTVGRATCGTAGCAEPSSTAPTISTTNITMEEYQCSLYVCRDDLEDMLDDTLNEINNALAECIDICIDNAFIANIGTRGGGSIVYAAGTFSAAIIAEAMGTMRNGTCEPVALIIHPVIEADLLQDSQFVNAATFGDRSVITGGHIIKYLGLDIIVVPKGSLYGNPAGTYNSILLSRHAIHAAKKRDPSIETQYMVQTQRKYIYASVRFGKSMVCLDGIWHILTTY